MQLAFSEIEVSVYCALGIVCRVDLVSWTSNTLTIMVRVFLLLGLLVGTLAGDV
jgi:hypothetical protein